MLAVLPTYTNPPVEPYTSVLSECLLNIVIVSDSTFLFWQHIPPLCEKTSLRSPLKLLPLILKQCPLGLITLPWDGSKLKFRNIYFPYWGIPLTSLEAYCVPAMVSMPWIILKIPKVSSYFSHFFCLTVLRANTSPYLHFFNCLLQDYYISDVVFPSTTSDCNWYPLSGSACQSYNKLQSSQAINER